jgi:hypothetical protein
MIKFPGLLLSREPRVEGEDIGDKKSKSKAKRQVSRKDTDITDLD